MSGLLQSCANYIFSWWSHTISETFPFNPRSPRISSPGDFNPNLEEVIDAFEEVINAFLHHQFALRIARITRIARIARFITEQFPDNESRAEPNQDLDRAQTPERN